MCSSLPSCCCWEAAAGSLSVPLKTGFGQFGPSSHTDVCSPGISSNKGVRECYCLKPVPGHTYVFWFIFLYSAVLDIFHLYNKELCSEILWPLMFRKKQSMRGKKGKKYLKKFKTFSSSFMYHQGIC